MTTARINLYLRDGLYRYVTTVRGVTRHAVCGYLSKEDAREAAEADARHLSAEEAAGEEYDYEVPE